MCKVIKKIRHKSADEILNLYDPGNSVPVDLSKILLGIGVNVMEARLNYLKISYYNQSGQAIIYGNSE